MPGRARSAQTQLRVGRLTKAHGLKGGLKLELFTDDPDRRFTPGASFSLQVPESSPWHGRRIELAELRWYNGHPVGFFRDVSDRSAAESLVKAILWIDQDPEESSEPDAWYDHELVGLDVVRDGETVGVIDRLEHLPAQDLLVVRLGDPSTLRQAQDGAGSGQRREVLVPFVRALVPEVDVAARRVVVTPPEGLFEALPDEDAEEEPEVREDEPGEQPAVHDEPAAAPDPADEPARVAADEVQADDEEAAADDAADREVDERHPGSADDAPAAARD